MTTELLSAHTAHELEVTHRLVVTWQHPETRSIRPVGVLSCGTEGFTFDYLAAARYVPGFRPFLGFAELERRYDLPTLFPFFAQRVMRPSRPDYAAYLSSLALSQDADAWSILARSQGARVGDTTRVFPEPEVTSSGRTRHTFFVNGVRHALADDPAAAHALSALTSGARVQLRDQPDNEISSRAVQVVSPTGVALGWVPDVLLGYVGTVRRAGPIDLQVTMVNGDDVPTGFRLLLTLEGQVPDGYEFFSGPGWAFATV